MPEESDDETDKLIEAVIEGFNIATHTGDPSILQFTGVDIDTREHHQIIITIIRVEDIMEGQVIQ